MAHTTKENRDVYYRRSKEEGYRARSAYKLLQIFQSFHVLYPILDRADARSILLNARCPDCQGKTDESRSNRKLAHLSQDSQQPLSQHPQEVTHHSKEAHHKQSHNRTCLDSDSEGEQPPFGSIMDSDTDCCLHEIVGPSTNHCQRRLTDYVKTRRSCLDLGRVRNVIDLCSAPGSWSQLLRNLVFHDHRVLREECEALSEAGGVCANLLEHVRVRPALVAIDIQQMAPIEGVHFLKGDITHPEVLERVRQLFLSSVARNVAESSGGARKSPAIARNAQLITCDGAPDVSGLHETDSFLQASLIRSALSVCLALLDVGGAFVCKSFFGSRDSPAFAHVSAFFEFCTVFKPPASRPASFEHFVVALGFRPLGHMLRTPSQALAPGHEPNPDLEQTALSGTVAATCTN